SDDEWLEDMSSVSSTTNDVHDGKDNHPNDINEMPVEGEGIHVVEVFLTDTAGQRKQENDQQSDKANGDVEGVESHQRVISGAKKIGTDGEILLEDEPPPLDAGHEKKNRTQRQRDKPQQAKHPQICFP